jgi:hypothetical protein
MRSIETLARPIGPYKEGKIVAVHGMKAYRGRTIRVPLILNLDTKRMRVVSFMPWGITSSIPI